MVAADNAVAADDAPEITSPGPRPEDLDEPPERHRYTWKHYVVLVIVAFVLGFLVLSLIDGAAESGAISAAPAGPAATPTTTSSALPTAPRGEL